MTTKQAKYGGYVSDSGHLVPVIDGVPIIYEDEAEHEDMGEANLHSRRACL